MTILQRPQFTVKRACSRLIIQPFPIWGITDEYSVFQRKHDFLEGKDRKGYFSFQMSLTNMAGSELQRFMINI